MLRIIEKLLLKDKNHDYCWRAVARQLSILYNSEIWPNSVGCKIVDLRSRMPSLYPGACGFGDMRSRFLYIRDMLVNAHGNIDRNSSHSRNQGHIKESDPPTLLCAPLLLLLSGDS